MFYDIFNAITSSFGRGLAEPNKAKFRNNPAKVIVKHPRIEQESVKMKAGFGTCLGMDTEFLKKHMLNRSSSNMPNPFEPLPHESRGIIKCRLVIARSNSYRNKPCLAMFSSAPSQFLSNPDIPIVTKRLKAFLTLSARDEQSESSDIPRILSQIAHRQRNVMIFAGVPAISYPNR